MRLSIITIATFLLIFSGCSGGPLDTEESKTEQNLVIKTKEELYAEAAPSIALLHASLLKNIKKDSSSISNVTRQNVISQVRQQAIDLTHQPNGPAVIKELSYEIQEIAKKARDKERWNLVLACVDVHEVLNMESYLLSKLDSRANEVLQRPKVEVEGYFTDNSANENFVFLKLTNRITKEVSKERVREGEEIQNLRLIEIIGRNRGVKLEYIPIEGLYFTVGSFGRELKKDYTES